METEIKVKFSISLKSLLHFYSESKNHCSYWCDSALMAIKNSPKMENDTFRLSLTVIGEFFHFRSKLAGYSTEINTTTITESIFALTSILPAIGDMVSAAIGPMMTIKIAFEKEKVNRKKSQQREEKFKKFESVLNFQPLFFEEVVDQFS